MGDPAAPGDASKQRLGADGQREVCRTVCETIQRDPARRESLQALLSCIDSPCEEFATCIHRVAQEAVSDSGGK